MADYQTLDNFSRPFSSIRLVYETEQPHSEKHWTEYLDRCTRLVMEVKEDELLSGIDLVDLQELAEMEETGFIGFDDDGLEEE